MSKDNFLLYNDSYTEEIKKLSYDQKGRLFDAIFHKAGAIADPPELDPLLRMAFSPISASMDRSHAKWKQTCQKRRESGRQGGRPKKQKQDITNPDEADPDGGKQQSEEKPKESKKSNCFPENQKEAKKAIGFLGFENEGEVREPETPFDEQAEKDEQYQATKTNCFLENQKLLKKAKEPVPDPDPEPDPEPELYPYQEEEIYLRGNWLLKSGYGEWLNLDSGEVRKARPQDRAEQGGPLATAEEVFI